MTSPKDILIAPMGVGGVQHLIERAYREGSELQYVRELFKNALEAGATRIEFGPEWRAVERLGVYRLMVAAAKDARLFDEAIALANQTPCDPRTLTRAARDFAETNPAFAAEAGFAALRWLIHGYGHEITSADVWVTYSHAIKAARNAGVAGDIRHRIRALIDSANARGGFVASVIARELELT